VDRTTFHPCQPAIYDTPGKQRVGWTQVMVCQCWSTPTLSATMPCPVPSRGRQSRRHSRGPWSPVGGLMGSAGSRAPIGPRQIPHQHPLVRGGGDRDLRYNRRCVCDIDASHPADRLSRQLTNK
jgi:hypothetical protein